MSRDRGHREAPQAYTDGAGGFVWAKTTVQTTGTTITVDIYGRGPEEDPTETNVDVFCPMFDSLSVMAVGAWVQANRVVSNWYAFVDVPYPEPL